MNGICRSCWANQLGAKRRRYIFTPALNTRLRRAYALPRTEQHSAIAELQRETTYPRHVFKQQAARLGVGRKNRPWTEQEIRVLRSAVGEVSIWEIAGRLKRSHGSVKAQAERLALSPRIREGYGVAEMAGILGVPRYRIQEWIEQGLLTAQKTDSGVRSTDAAVMTFVRENYNLIDFRLADQTWLKGVLFGS
jgi:hypothetical protein